MALSKNLGYVAILIDGPPEVILCAIDGVKDFIHIPRVAGSGTVMPCSLEVSGHG
jgi:hypothetical protein